MAKYAEKLFKIDWLVALHTPVTDTYADTLFLTLHFLLKHMHLQIRWLNMLVCKMAQTTRHGRNYSEGSKHNKKK